MVQSAGEEKRSPALSEVRALPADPEDAARDMLTKAPGRGATVAELESADPEPETVKHPQASSSIPEQTRVGRSSQCHVDFFG